MKQCVGEKSVAWFRLAECINRGEKERALNLYRLLTHSFHDPAFIKKLEADIIATFDKELAVKEYMHAAHVYCKRGDAKEAVLIYQLLVDLFLQTHKITKVTELLDQLHEQLDVADYAAVTQFFVYKALEYNLSDQELITKYLHQTLTIYTKLHLDRQLQQCMARLQLLSQEWSMHAVRYVSMNH